MEAVNNPAATNASVGDFCPARSEMELARKLHRSLLPLSLQNERADVASFCREHSLLGGDYGTAYWQTPERLFLCVCDVTGHGIASALLAARINTFVRLEVQEAAHPCVVVEDLNRFLVTHFGELGLYATFFCAVVDWREWRIQFAGAGHPPALLCRAGGGIERLSSRMAMLGVFDDLPNSCAVDSVAFEPGDRLLLYTDGIIEATSADQSYFEIEGLEKSLSDFNYLNGTADAPAIIDHLLRDLDAFNDGAEMEDDVLLLAVCLR